MMTTPPITVGNCSSLPLDQLGGVHRCVGGAEVDGAIEDLVLPATRADRLVVQLDADCGLRRLAPFGIDRRRECGSRTGDLLRTCAKGETGQANGQGRDSDPS